MAFSRANPGGWAAHDKLTSAQANQVDIDHASALDKSVAGDTLSGAVTMASTASIRASNAGAQIRGDVAGGIQSNIAGGIQSNAIGGIALAASLDWPTFGGATRTRNIRRQLVPFGLATGWAAGGGGSAAWALTGPATGVGQSCVLTDLHNGATLAALKLYIVVTGPHANVPANLPSVLINRSPMTTGAAFAVASLRAAGAAFFPTPGSGAAWDASNNIQSWTFTCDQNNVIDTSTYAYYIRVTDENSTNSVAGNLFLAYELDYTTIANMQFP